MPAYYNNGIEIATPYLNGTLCNAYLNAEKVFNFASTIPILTDPRDLCIIINPGNDTNYYIPMSHDNRGTGSGLNYFDIDYYYYPKGFYGLKVNGSASGNSGYIQLSDLTPNTEYIIVMYPANGIYSNGWCRAFGYSYNVTPNSNVNNQTNRNKLISVYNIDLSNFVYYGITSSSVVKYDYFLWGAFKQCYNLVSFNDNINSTLTIPVNSTPVQFFFSETFYDDTLLEEVHLPKIIIEDNIGVHLFSYMFYHCASIEHIPLEVEIDYKGSGYPGVGHSFMRSMYNGCTSLEEVDDDPDFGGIVKVGEFFMAQKFFNCSSITLPAKEVEWNTDSNVLKQLAYGFRYYEYGNCTSLTVSAKEECPISVSIPHGTTFEAFRSHQYAGCSNLTKITDSLIDPAVTFGGDAYAYYRQRQFYDCNKLSLIDSNFNTVKLPYISYQLLTDPNTFPPNQGTSSKVILSEMFSISADNTGDSTIDLELVGPNSTTVTLSSITPPVSNSPGKAIVYGRNIPSSTNSYYSSAY